MELKHFKKIHEDDDATTLRHYAGHEIKIAHKKLSSKMREKLKDLPTMKAKGGKVEKSEGISDQGRAVRKAHEYAQNPDQSMGRPSAEGTNNIAKTYARTRSFVEKGTKPNLKGLAHGGRVMYSEGADIAGEMDQERQSPQDFQPQQPMPASVQDQGPDPAAMAQGVPASLAPNAPAPQAQQQDQSPAEANQPQAPAQPQQQASVEPPSISKAIVSRQPAQATNQAFDQEYMAMKNDFMNGHIQPKTYQSMFADKDTLGKTGTLFGLLMSGFGSGLSHQPNMVMDMMDKEINRDLEAQKQTKSNQLNWMNSMNQHYLAKSQAALQGAQTQETLANAGLAKANAGIAVQTSAKLAMMNAVLAQATGMVNKLPPGPQQQQGMQAVQGLSNGIDQKAMQMNAQASQQMSDNSERQFQQQQKMMTLVPELGEQTKYNESHHQAGIPGQSSTDLEPNDREFFKSGQSFQGQLDRFMDWTKNHSGDISPSDRNQGRALAAELQGAYRQATHGGVYKEGEQNFISKLIDENPTKFFNEIRVMPSLQALSESNKSRLQDRAHNLGFSVPAAGSKYQAPQGQPPQANHSVSKSGRPMEMVNGQWRYK